MEPASILFHLALFVLLTATPAAGQPGPPYRNCSVTNNFTASSNFSSNLKTLLSNLTTAAPSTGGYAKAAVGTGPDIIYGLANCRGDINAGNCSECLSNAVKYVRKTCQSSHFAALNYDLCVLRYSYQSFFGEGLTVGSRVVIGHVNTNVTSGDASLYHQRRGQLMSALISWVEANSTERLFATGEVNFTVADPKIYGLAQCTRDLAPERCLACLRSMLDFMQQRRWTVMLSVLSASCSLKYDFRSKFYNGVPDVIVPASLEVDSNAPPPLQFTGMPPAPTQPPRSMLPPPPLPAKTTKTDGSKNTSQIVTIITPITIILVLLSCVFLYFIRRKKKMSRTKSHNKAPPKDSSIEPPLFHISTIRAATNNFSDENKLGQGGFGPVYLGLLSNGCKVAVKRLSRNSAQGLEELKAEFMLVAKLQHRNLVNLLGICLEEEEKLLVYEFLPNKSLDTFLFDEVKRRKLDWKRRYRIIEGIVRGLQYLHEESPLKIIHRDLKASNILLDADMNPKISDFGLARRFDIDQSQERTHHAAGTLGYMAPEYVMHGRFSRKSDVYSLCVLLLEIITGREKRNLVDSGRCVDLLSYVWEHWVKGTITRIVDPSLGRRFSKTEVMRCVQIGLLCIQDDPEKRPSVSSIGIMLQSFTVTVEAPTRPTLLVVGNFHGQSKSSVKILQTVNEVSITELEAR